MRATPPDLLPALLVEDFAADFTDDEEGLTGTVAVNTESVLLLAVRVEDADGDTLPSIGMMASAAFNTFDGVTVAEFAMLWSSWKSGLGISELAGTS